MKRLSINNNIKNKIPALIVFMVIFLLWQMASSFEFIPKFMLPSPISVLYVFTSDYNLLITNLTTTLFEAIAGLLVGIFLGFLIAFLMDKFKIIYKAFYPILIISQTVPTIAIAPILVLFLGYGLFPKITLVALCCFFPIAISFLSGFESPSIDYMNLLKTMGANKNQIFIYIKLPFSLKFFCSGLKISVSYAFVAAVVSEWLGGISGLGVYMIRAKKSYAFDKMFAVLLLICIVSFIFIKIAELFEKCVIPWERKRQDDE
ncbi:MAG: ABC transporter permease [Eubacteriales bacterium SKADARSKE-1]|nr:ABC transporter permease [Eubacteriales bacterium SKADARSKE-1]